MDRFLAVITICLLLLTLSGPAYAGEVKRAQTAASKSTNKPSAKGISWEGSYTFSEDPGRNARTGPMIAEHRIVIHRQGDELIADIDADGYQTIRRLRCDAKVTGNRVTFYFKSYREDNGFTPYEKGQKLLAFERATARGRIRILTYWGAYEPIFRRLKSKRVYFEKTK